MSWHVCYPCLQSVHYGKSNQNHCSDASPYGYPAILTNTGQRANSLRSDMRATNPVSAAFLGDA